MIDNRATEDKFAVQGEIRYQINEKERTAYVVKCDYFAKEITIPRSIKHESTEFIVTSILENAFNNTHDLTTVQFAPDSEVKTINDCAFASSTIKSLSIPASVINLTELWCYYTPKLYHIEVDSKNPRYSCPDGKTIIDKSDNSLVFAVRDIDKISIPPFIEEIKPFAFGFCKKLHQIEIPKNSELRKIDKNAFSNSEIESIYIPSNLVELEEGWCADTYKLNKIEVDENNQMYSIYENQFIIGKTKKENKDYDVLVFAVRNIVEVTIPSFIKVIDFSAFECCQKIHQIEIQKDSQLQTINKYAFFSSSIMNINIPKSVKKIGQFAFSYCKYIEKLVFPPNSELQTIDEEAFSHSSIKSIKFPDHVKKISEKTFYLCSNLEYVSFSANSELRSIDTSAFYMSSIEYIKIPSHVTIIKNSAFSNCKKLRQIDFAENSELQTIDNYAFFFTSIRRISIPAKLTRIGDSAFHNCVFLREFEIPKNSELKTIEKCAFSFSNIESIYIPPQITNINYIFKECENLCHIEIPKDSQLQIIDKDAFSSTSIESIFIPANVIELRKGWCCCTPKLNKISVDENNQMYSCFDNKFIIGKSRKENKDYDILVFAVRDIVDATIPSFIKVIDAYAFEFCENLREIEIPKDSKLQTIGDDAFYKTPIEKITIPSHQKNIFRKAIENEKLQINVI